MVQYTVKLYTELYCVLLNIAFVYYTNTLSRWTDHLKLKWFHDYQTASKSFSKQLNPIRGLQTISSYTILIYSTTNSSEQTVVLFLGLIMCVCSHGCVCVCVWTPPSKYSLWSMSSAHWEHRAPIITIRMLLLGYDEGVLHCSCLHLCVNYFLCS